MCHRASSGERALPANCSSPSARSAAMITSSDMSQQSRPHYISARPHRPMLSAERWTAFLRPRSAAVKLSWSGTTSTQSTTRTHTSHAHSAGSSAQHGHKGALVDLACERDRHRFTPSDVADSFASALHNRKRVRSPRVGGSCSFSQHDQPPYARRSAWGASSATRDTDAGHSARGDIPVTRHAGATVATGADPARQYDAAAPSLRAIRPSRVV